MQVSFGVLGPVAVWDGTGEPIDVKGPKHRAVLARLIVARGRVVPVDRLVDDLWAAPPPGAVGAVRTFVAALRRALEPHRPPRQPARLLVTEGPGYALRAARDAVDAWRFEAAVAGSPDEPAQRTLDRLDRALGWWRGPAYAGFDDESWARPERGRLEQLRLYAVESRAGALLALGRAAESVADLDAHVAEHPWREEAWRLLALALYRTDRQGDALAVLRRARDLLVDQLGIDPGPRLRRLETDILRQAEPADTAGDPGPPGDGVLAEMSADRVWAETAAAYDQTVASGARARIESTVGLLRSLALTGGAGLEAARRQRFATIAAAEQLGDPELAARVIGGYDVPAIWTRSDDPEQAARIVAAAERALAALHPDSSAATRARLLGTIAVESRGIRAARGPEAAREAERIARGLADPVLLAFALNGVFMQSFQVAGLAPERDAIGTEIVALATRHGLPTYQVLGHLIRLQARSALGDFAGADRHAAAADGVAERHERPLVAVFTRWYRALRLAATGAAVPEVEAAYRSAAAQLTGTGMPGVERGLLPLALLCLQVWHGRPADPDEHPDWGPYAPWARPLVLLAQGRPADAAGALRQSPEPPPDLLFEALWCLTGQAAIMLEDRPVLERAHAALAPAAHELAGAGSGMLTAGPVAQHLDRLGAALRRTPG
ncbi:BTAD domain-containing putative transcriptional regulator [Micromonospora sp. WMMD1102]|uniref:BTAD domain-containing putative transcriptional regulator n=1 Tax=Micromonospora sp. WMMD1102 TaxID=3016105 RepID=UPI002414E1B3|nr:BTAD domain-containing putative transcriptional regulator [Micromonospora sp. WMMD1102]MDG4786973.1 BTAD domain-containing putative transcriptional regulator [Micromonospora sp. WMMD1102]